MKETNNSKKTGDINASRRKLLGQLGKAAYVAPVLTLLSLKPASAQVNPPSCVPPDCPLPDSSKNKSDTRSSAPSRNKDNRG